MASWELVRTKGVRPARREGHSCEAVGDALFVMFGHSADGTYFDDLFMFDVGSRIFVPLPKGPPARAFHASAGDGRGRIFVHGGCVLSQGPVVPTGSSLLTMFSRGGGSRPVGPPTLENRGDLWMFETESNMWTMLHDGMRGGEHRCPRARDGHVMVLVDNALYLFGGSDQQSCLNDSWRFDLHELRWQELQPSSPPSARRLATALRLDRKVLLLGGYDGVHRGVVNESIHALDIDAMAWEAMPNSRMPLRVGWGHAMAHRAGDAGVFVLGGSLKRDELGQQQAFQRFDLADRLWETIEVDGFDLIPHRLRCHTLSMGPDRALWVFGGSLSGAAQEGVWRLALAPLAPPVQNAFASDMRGLLEDRDSQDVKIEVGGQVFGAHQAILEARSAFFRAMFRSDMREALEGVIAFGDVEPEHFKTLLDYYYTGEATVNEINAMAILELADRVDDAFLRATAEDFVRAHITAENVTDLLEEADRLQSDVIRRACVDFLRRSLDAGILDRASLADLPKDLLVDLLAQR